MTSDTEAAGAGNGSPAAGTSSPAKTGKIFGVVGLAIFTFSFLANANETPQLAMFGLGTILIFVIIIVFFLGPTAMASAELGAAYPRTGGIYVWTRLAFGEAAAFMIIWLEFANFMVAWPGIMGSLTVQSSYLIDPALANNPTFVSLTGILVTWLAAALALRGLRVAKGFAWYSVLAGTLIPALMIIGFAIAYLAKGNPIAMDVSMHSLIPPITAKNVAFISGALLMFSGIEIAAIHAGDVHDPGRTIPRANLIAVILCFAIFAPLALAIAAVLPSDEINIVAGLIQSGEAIFNKFHAGWLTAVLSFLLVTGLIAALIQILSGPSRGLVVAAKVGGNLPPALQRENRNKMPVAIILMQAAISSVLALGYGLLGSVENAWLIFGLIQTNMVLIMYMVMFASVVKLRYARPRDIRPYVIPGKKLGLWVVTAVGIIVCFFAMIVSLIPTEEAGGMSTAVYVLVIVGGTVLFACIPFVFWIFRKPSWKTLDEGDVNDDVGDPEAIS